MLSKKYLQHLLDKANRPFEKRPGSSDFHASSIGFCSRRQVYKALGFPEEEKVNAENQWVFKIGTGIHELIQKDFMKLGLIKPMFKEDGTVDEFKIKKEEYSFAGRVDGVNPDDAEEPFVFELKTCAATVYKGIVFRKKPLKKHVDQVQIYLGFLGYKKASLVYLNKDNLLDTKTQSFYDRAKISNTFYEFEIKFDQEHFESLIKKLELMNASVKSYRKKHGNDLIWQAEELPEKITGPDCNNCPFKSNCKAERKVRAKKEQPKKLTIKELMELKGELD